MSSWIGARAIRIAIASPPLTRLALLAIVVTVSSPYFLPPLNSDAAAILQFAQRMASGERLYVDLIDINPPMVFWLSFVPAWLADLTSLPAHLLFVACVLAGAAGSVWFASRIAACGEGLRSEFRMMNALTPALVIFCLLIYPRVSFGEREHLLMVTLLPYIVSAARRLAEQTPTRSFRVGAASIALLGVCLKPHFLFIVIAVEGLIVFRLGPRKSPVLLELLAFGFGGAAYLCLSVALYPTYFSQIVPLAGRLYGAYDVASMLRLLQEEQLSGLLIVGVPILLIAGRARNQPILQVLAAASIGAIFAATLQFKDWGYHFLPARAGVIASLALLVAQGFDQATPRPLLRRIQRVYAVAGVMGALLYLSGAVSPPFRAQLWYGATRVHAYEKIISELAKGESVLWLVQDVTPYPALNYANARQAMRFMCLWMLPAIYSNNGVTHYSIIEEMSLDERWLFNSVIEDFVRNKPNLVVTIHGPDDGFHSIDFDYIEYFRRNLQFNEAWSDYTFVGTVRGMDVYRRATNHVWRRFTQDPEHDLPLHISSTHRW